MFIPRRHWTVTALAAVATTGYCGYLAGPPLIGFVAELIGLRGALGIVSLACGIVAVTATLVLGPRLTVPASRDDTHAAATHTTERSHA